MDNEITKENTIVEIIKDLEMITLERNFFKLKLMGINQDYIKEADFLNYR